MKLSLLTKVIFYLLFLVCINVFGQSTTSTSGKDINGTGGTISYSVGQVEYQLYSNSNLSLAEGVIHPYEMFEINETDTIKEEFLVYPNPVKNDLFLSINRKDFETFKVQIYNLEGKLIGNISINNTLTHFDLTEFSTTMYLFEILQNNKKFRTFKIIKN